MYARNNNDGTWTVFLDEIGPNGPVLTVPSNTTPHQLWQQILALCAANGIHLIPAMVAINASGTTGTMLS